MDGCLPTGRLPVPDGPLTVGTTAGMCAAGEEAAVISRARILAFRREDEEDIPSKQVLWVCPYVGYQAKRRLFECSSRKGIREPTDHVSLGWRRHRAGLQLYLNPQAEHLLDWFIWRCA